MGSFKQDIKDTYLGLSESLQEKWGDFTQFLQETWPLLILLLVILMGVWWYADPPPPRHVLMATGSPGGSYEDLGKKYADFFAKKGITLELVPTLGAQENIDRLADRDDPIQAGFVQAGVAHAKDVKGIESLGAIAYDPIWFFYRGSEIKNGDLEAHTGHFKYFSSKTISIGVKGGGTYAQASKILQVSGFEHLPKFVYLSGEDAVKALKAGKIDGAFIVDSFEAPNVQELLNDPSLHLVTFTRAEAYVKVIPHLHILNVPQGSFDLSRNFPPSDMKLLATTTNLLIDDRMHPAIQFLFLEAAREINGKESFFSERGEFPSFKDSMLPESPVAVHYEKNNYPLLMAYFPFWIAELINRLIFVLLPFCVLGYPLLQALPGYRAKRMQNKINRLYGSLKALEQELLNGFNDEQRDEYLKRLNLLEYQALRIKVSKRLSSDYYTLRTSIDYVRNCLNRGEHPYGYEDFDSNSQPI
ncbi:TRAP transporter substrate-binding protein [Polynucleobacter sp. AP-Capit-er-40B-B4]|uniref:TAXI family TRAP transporter solute-binding subunit n=1 Tax=Polynucleobacter sp. AP-Capit-er-40B-B4 TaxID=2576927 RepID=UPI001C0CE686|nr:TAXI family TRAP transporter solute-binding subunit [Polynucleobacter sp. AP-Capit-er-40B-B4]MBU3582320.1 TRAP transporter substrate-binding protein [Polynucleobacter sp. AP-Capit-er-40B-B4]